MKRRLFFLPLVALVMVGCYKTAEPIGSPIEAPGASKMPDPPARTRPDVPGLNRGNAGLNGS